MTLSTVFAFFLNNRFTKPILFLEHAREIRCKPAKSLMCELQKKKRFRKKSQFS